MLAFRRKTQGVTLLEILLVLAIASSLLIMMLNYTTQRSDEMRRTKTVLQMQQILNGGLSFYINNSFWPLKDASISSTLCDDPGGWTDTSALKPNYLPRDLNNNPYGQPYFLNCTNVANGGGFFIYTIANNPTNAAIIAGKLPMAYRTTTAFITSKLPPLSCKAGNDCTVVVASVNIPGQNLNNARSVNFASVYYSGSCVPAPNCPPNMKQDIMVMPASVNGVNDSPASCPSGSPFDPSLCTGTKSYSVNGFTAFARGIDLTTGKPGDPNGVGTSAPLSCQTSRTPAAQSCVANPDGARFQSDGTLYWRVCLSVTTEKGTVSATPGSRYFIQQGKMMGSVIAITRCVPNDGNEYPSGSVNVYLAPYP